MGCLPAPIGYDTLLARRCGTFPFNWELPHFGKGFRPFPSLLRGRRCFHRLLREKLCLGLVSKVILTPETLSCTFCGHQDSNPGSPRQVWWPRPPDLLSQRPKRGADRRNPLLSRAGHPSEPRPAFPLCSGVSRRETPRRLSPLYCGVVWPLVGPGAGASSSSLPATCLSRPGLLFVSRLP